MYCKSRNFCSNQLLVLLQTPLTNFYYESLPTHVGLYITTMSEMYIALHAVRFNRTFSCHMKMHVMPNVITIFTVTFNSTSVIFFSHSLLIFDCRNLNSIQEK